MAVNVQAKGQGGITLGGKLDFSQVTTMGSPATMSAVLFVILLAVVILLTLSLR